MSRTAALLLCVVSLFANPVFAGECDNAHPSFYVVLMTCDRTKTGGPCSMSQPLSFWVDSWVTPSSCATTTWDFADGTGAVSTGATPVKHSYALAGNYVVSAVISIPATSTTLTLRRSIQVANGMVNTEDRILDEGASGEIRMRRTNVTEAIQVPWRLRIEGSTTTPSESEVAPTSGVLSFDAGQQTATATVQSIENTRYVYPYEQRYLKIDLGAITGGFLSANNASLTINEDDYPVVDFAQQVMPVLESAGTAPLLVSRVGGDPNAPFTVGYLVRRNSVGMGSYGTMVFAAGEMSRSFNVMPIDDSIYTGTRHMSTVLQYPSHGARFPAPAPYNERQGLIEVVDDEAPPKPQITATDVAIAEGHDGKRVVSIELVSPVPFDGGIYYTVTSPDATPGLDFSAVEPAYAYLTAAGGTRGQISLEVAGDRDVESDEVIVVSLSASSFDPVTVEASATVTILNDDASLGPNFLQIRRGRSASLLVNVGSAPREPLVIALSTDRPDLVQIPATITIPARENRTTLEATGLMSDGSFFTITADFPADHGGPKSIRARVYEPMQLTFEPPVLNVVEGQEIPVRVSLTPDDSTRELALHVVDPAVAAVPASITIDRGHGTFLLQGLTAGTTFITIVNPDGSDAESVLEVNVLEPGDAPSIASISPATGPAAGGTSFVASGVHLSRDCTLSFGGVPVTEVTLADGTLTGATPAHAAGVVDVALTCGSEHFVLTNAFTYLSAPPTLASIAPAFGSTDGGTLVHATGTNFQSGCWMFFDGEPAAAVAVDSTSSLTAMTPARAAGDRVESTVRCGSASSSPVWFTYRAEPEPSAAILEVDPLVGAAGQSVTIAGSRFRIDDHFRFGDASATILRTRSHEQLVRIPELPLGMNSIIHTDFAGRTTTTGPVFLVLEPAPPRITSVEPARTLPGSEDALLGSGFRPGYFFAIGGRTVEIVSLAYDRTLVRLANDVPAGLYPMQVLDAAGAIVSIGPAVIVGGATLRIHAAFPDCGTTDGGTAVTITGTDLAIGATVMFNGVAATDVELLASDALRATTPAGRTGPATLVITQSNGDTATVTAAFRYVSPFDPNGGCGGGRQRGVRK